MNFHFAPSASFLLQSLSLTLPPFLALGPFLGQHGPVPGLFFRPHPLLLGLFRLLFHDLEPPLVVHFTTFVGKARLDRLVLFLLGELPRSQRPILQQPGRRPPTIASRGRQHHHRLHLCQLLRTDEAESEILIFRGQPADDAVIDRKPCRRLPPREADGKELANLFLHRRRENRRPPAAGIGSGTSDAGNVVRLPARLRCINLFLTKRCVGNPSGKTTAPPARGSLLVLVPPPRVSQRLPRN